MGGLGLVVGSGSARLGSFTGPRATLARHGSGEYVLPHEIDHVANMRALVDAGCDRVFALSSVGGLRRELVPGTLLCPDDLIALDARPVTALSGSAAHRVPGFDREWRERVVAALSEAGDVIDGGVYWQANGPRFETPAEIRMIAQHADVIGMTVASESTVAGELGLRYATLCVVDNLASGIGGPFTLAEIEANRAEARGRLGELLRAVMPHLA
jgi:5'-methylthioadenosine phosphorylase